MGRGRPAKGGKNKEDVWTCRFAKQRTLAEALGSDEVRMPGSSLWSQGATKVTRACESMYASNATKLADVARETRIMHEGRIDPNCHVVLVRMRKDENAKLNGMAATVLSHSDVPGRGSRWSVQLHKFEAEGEAPFKCRVRRWNLLVYRAAPGSTSSANDAHASAPKKRYEPAGEDGPRIDDAHQTKPRAPPCFAPFLRRLVVPCVPLLALPLLAQMRTTRPE